MQIERGFSLPSGKPPAGKTWDPKLQVWVDQQGNQLTVEEQKAESKRKKEQKKNQKKKLRRALNKGFDAANEETEMVDQEDQEEAEAASVEESSPAEAAAVEDERASFNDAILKAEPPRRWLDNGTARVSLGETHADSLYRFLRFSRHARNASNRTRSAPMRTHHAAYRVPTGMKQSWLSVGERTRGTSTTARRRPSSPGGSITRSSRRSTRSSSTTWSMRARTSQGWRRSYAAHAGAYVRVYVRVCECACVFIHIHATMLWYINTRQMPARRA